MQNRTRSVARWQDRLRRIGSGAANAVALMRTGRLGAPYRTPFTVVHHERTYKLRRYQVPQAGSSANRGEPLVLVPPLMLTSEVYDMAPEISVVAVLLAAGIDVWVVDFGAPEEQEGGMERTLDDHVLAVDQAVSFVANETGQKVHLGGYSQGGMFVYQAAAYRRSADLASLVTFGSPVDIHRNLPVKVHDDLADRVIRAASAMLSTPIEHLSGLPGALTSTAFKLLTPRKEVRQVVDFFGHLHDRRALESRESRRRFLNGEGFVAWPGPALRTLIDEFVVNNRMTSGGFVIAGRTVSLADITVPVLCFVGTKDEIARPASVEAIVRAAPAATVHIAHIRAGHFGLVVGSTSLATTWPTVISWIEWLGGRGEIPAMLRPAGQTAEAEEGEEIEEAEEAPFDDVRLNVEAMYDFAADAVDALWRGIGDVSRDVGEVVDSLRWQLPRLARLRKIDPDTVISVGQALTDQAEAIPHQTFFLWQGRAFSYQDADRRVEYVARGLIECGVRPGMHVGIVMDNRPSYLTMVAALSRLGAVSVLLAPHMARITLGEAATASHAEVLVVEPEHAREVRAAFDGPVLVLGGGGEARSLVPGVIDLEAVDPDAVVLPDWYTPNPGKARDVAMITFTAGATGKPKPVRVTNRRWALGALGTASACVLTPKDTVYCALGLHTTAAMLLAVSGALVGGARLALAPRFSPRGFWTDVRRYGATVLFHSGEMARSLLLEPPDAGDSRNPLRLIVGHGLREHDWSRIVERFGPIDVIEYYASAEGTVVLTNLPGEKRGSVGRPFPYLGETILATLDPATGKPLRDDQGHLVPVNGAGVGLLLGVLDRRRIEAFDGYVDRGENTRRLLRGAFVTGDLWFDTGDVFERDEEGDFKWLGRAEELVLRGDTFTCPRVILDSVDQIDGIGHAVVSVSGTGKKRKLTLRCSVRTGAKLTKVTVETALHATLGERAPDVVELVERVELLDNLRVDPMQGKVSATSRRSASRAALPRA